MKLFRYRKPSVNRMLGITKVKKAVRKATGINAVARLSPSRIKQRAKQKVGIYSPTMTAIRQTTKGKLPIPIMPEVSIAHSGTKESREILSDQSTYSVQGKPGEIQCPRCGQSMGEPIKETKGLIFKKETQYFVCNNCSSRYNIRSMSGTWKCEACNKEFSTKEACEEHEQTHHSVEDER